MTMLYATDGADRVVLVPDLLAHEMFRAREVLPYCATWGDARSGLDITYFLELVDHFIGPGEEAPPDDQPRDARELTRDGDWPGLCYLDIEEWIPDGMVGPSGKSWSEILRTRGRLAAEHGDDLIRDLRQSGVVCTEDRTILELFVD
jgi:hypothetical protein